MGCHPKPIDELHHFSRWLLHHQLWMINGCLWIVKTTRYTFHTWSIWMHFSGWAKLQVRLFFGCWILEIQSTRVAGVAGRSRNSRFECQWIGLLGTILTGNHGFSRWRSWHSWGVFVKILPLNQYKNWYWKKICEFQLPASIEATG